MVTIQDVARSAGVSPMTVSHVINDHPYVRDTTRAKVVKAMADLGYRVNVAARNLRTGRTYTIGLAVAEIDRPYWGQLAAHIIEEASRHDLRVLIEQTGASRESELDALSLSRNRMYDGLILSTVGLSGADTELLNVDYPIVILGERIFDGPVDHVAMANVEGTYAAIRHLIHQGCRRIATIDDHASGEVNMSTLRYAGFARAHEEAGLAVDPALGVDRRAFGIRDGYLATRELVERGAIFDGLFCVTDTVALGALRALKELGIDVPAEVKVMGFDNILEGEFSVPSLSTVDPDHRGMARAAVDLLVRRIGEPRGGDHPIEFVSSYEVIERESTRVTG